MNYDTYLNFRLTKKQKAELVKEAKRELDTSRDTC
jgi:hypothetical protein